MTIKKDYIKATWGGKLYVSASDLLHDKDVKNELKNLRSLHREAKESSKEEDAKVSS